ncbi:hypothetical protein [Sphingomonas aracearum]|uniref:hypothetical protein n=1 Tax=Sphingomonas aracearum TaxID=2283317 RepID=UPI0015F0C2D9|nr:hypothetical protein [Sphingomonas aracearum]
MKEKDERTEREARRAAALRENLRRRKAQARAVVPESEGSPAAGHAPDRDEGERS